MKLSEAKYILEDAGYIIEDTDEYDDADLGLNVKPKEYHKQKAKMSSLKDRVIQAYEDFIRRKEKDAEQSWKKNVKYRGGGNDEDDLMDAYKDRWEEKFPHKNTMTLYEFYKIMMSNYDTRSYIKENSKVSDLEGTLVGKNQYYDGSMTMTMIMMTSISLVHTNLKIHQHAVRMLQQRKCLRMNL